MDRLKSIFVSGYVAYFCIALIYVTFQLVAGDHTMIWIFNLIIYGSAAFYFAKIFLVRTPRTTHKMTGLTAAVGLGFIGVVYAYFEMTNNVALILGLTGFIGWLLYTFWATDFGSRDTNAIKIGTKMPDVSFKTPDGESVKISKYLNTPAVILFYRGNWCPFCMAQMKELAAEYRKIKEKGASLIFISPQSPKHTKSLAKKFDIPAIFLIDEDLKAAKELNIFNAFGTPLGMEVLGYDTDNVFPTLIITDKKGIVRLADLTDNYRVRPEPDNYLRILDEIG
jgi:peroxiredoxin